MKGNFHVRCGVGEKAVITSKPYLSLLTIEAENSPIEILFMNSIKLSENVAWLDPIVMNTKQQIIEAFTELENGNFIKEQTNY